MAETKYISYKEPSSSSIWVPVEHDDHLDNHKAMITFLGSEREMPYKKAGVHSPGYISGLGGGNAGYQLITPQRWVKKDGHFFILLVDTTMLRKIIDMYSYKNITLDETLINKTRWEMIS